MSPRLPSPRPVDRAAAVVVRSSGLGWAGRRRGRGYRRQPSEACRVPGAANRTVASRPAIMTCVIRSVQTTRKLPPGRAFPALGRWSEAVLLEDIGDRAPGHVMTQIGQGPADPGVASVPVLSRHLHDQLPDLGHNLPAPGVAPVAAVVFLRDGSSMPAEQRIRSHQGVDLGDGPASERLGFRGQAAALHVRETETPRREVLPQDPVLLLETLRPILSSGRPARRRPDVRNAPDSTCRHP